MTDTTATVEARVTQIVSAFVAELRRDQPAERVQPGMQLERDLGIYSLERVELMLRLERACGIELPDQLSDDVVSVGDLACMLAGQARPPRQAVELWPTRARVPPAPIGSLLFTTYIGLLVVLSGSAVWPILQVLPHGRRAGRVLQRALRTIFRAAMCPIEVSGVEHLHGTMPAMLVANHQSYLDSLVLLAALPILPNVVVNERLPRAPLIGTGVRAAGFLAVDRTTLAGRLAFADAMVRALAAGETLLVFPEATFHAGPDLLPFRLGAFSAAVEAGRPVIPITLRGTRDMLPCDARVLRRSRLSVTIHAPLHPEDRGWKEALRLRERAREQIAETPS